LRIKLKKSKLEKIIIGQNSKIKELNDQVNALKSQNKSLKMLLQRPGWDSSWFDANLRRVERELAGLRRLVDQKKKDHQDLEDQIKEIENGPTKKEEQ
jgi:cell division protein FtsL